MFGLSGVPVSRLVLQDSHYDQIMVGGFEGMIAGCVSHICYSKLMKKHWDPLRKSFLGPCLICGCSIPCSNRIEKFLNSFRRCRRSFLRHNNIDGFEFLGIAPKDFTISADDVLWE